MPEIIDLTASSPVLAPARAPSPTPSLEWIKTEARDDDDEFLDINELVKEEKLSPAPTAAPAPTVTPAAAPFRRRRSPSTSSSSSSSSSSLSSSSDQDEVDGKKDGKKDGKEEPALAALSSRMWDDVDAAFVEISNAAKGLGFGVIKRRPSNYRHGKPTRYDIECAEGAAHSGWKRKDGAPIQRPMAASIKKGCQWKAKLVFYAKIQGWQFVLMKSGHCHDLNPDSAQYYAANRRIQRTGEVEASILRMAKQPKTSSTDIASAIREEFDITITGRDVLNVLAVNKQKLAGALTPTQQFLDGLNKTEGIFKQVYRHNDEEDGLIERVFWSYPWCIEQLRKNPEVMSLDCTYKVNKFDMPLLQICGVTAMHTTFNIGYCLLSGEREACFTWAFNQIAAMLNKYDIPQPLVIVTDYDKACKKACRAVFPTTQHQICLWHVMKNVAFNVKKKWEGSLEGTALGNRGSDGSHLREDHHSRMDINPANEDSDASRVASMMLNKEDREHHLESGTKNPHNQPIIDSTGKAPEGSNREWLDNADGILGAWKAVVYSDTEEGFYEQWRVLLREFPKQKPITDYLLETYLPLRYEFAHFAIRSYRNFGIRVTSRTEGAHGVLKALLKNRRIDLNQLLGAINETLKRLKENFASKYTYQISKSVAKYNHTALARVKFVTSFACLELLQRQATLASDAITKRRDLVEARAQCSTNFNRQYGLPCWHDLLDIVRTGGTIPQSMVEKHWWLKPEKPLSEDWLALRRERDPLPVVTNRWKARNGAQPLPAAASRPAPSSSRPAPPSSSVRCDPSHDAPPKASTQPPPKKKRMTKAVLASQREQEARAEAEHMRQEKARLEAQLQELRDSRQREAQLEARLRELEQPRPPPVYQGYQQSTAPMVMASHQGTMPPPPSQQYHQQYQAMPPPPSSQQQYRFINPYQPPPSGQQQSHQLYQQWYQSQSSQQHQ